jgi:chemotaxis protein MotB
MSAGKKRFKVKSDALWMTSFADLSFLLMAFFALMLSFSSFDKQRFENVRDGSLAKSNKKIESPKVVEKKTNNLDTMNEELLEVIQKHKLDVTVSQDLEGISVELNEKLLFASGSAQLNQQYNHLSKKIFQIIASSSQSRHISFEGHTDDIPMRPGSAIRDNWQLSSMRAVSILDEFRRLGIREDFMSIGAFAHTRPKVPFAKLSGKNLDAARSANRRVVIKIR